MYSKELQMMDRNTVRYMIDEMQEELDRSKEERDEAVKEKEAAIRAVREKEAVIKERDAALKAKDEEIERLKAESKKDKPGKFTGGILAACIWPEVPASCDPCFIRNLFPREKVIRKPCESENIVYI